MAPVRQAERVDQFQIFDVAAFIEGLNTTARSDQISDGQTPYSRNVTFRDRRVRVDTGYSKIGTAVVGTPQKAFVHEDSSGGRKLILVTQATFYEYDESEADWIYVDDGTMQTLIANEPMGETSIAVADESNYGPGDLVGVQLDDGTQHKTTVNSTSPGVVVIDVGLPSAASIGNALVHALELNGDDDNQVVMAAVPSNDWTVFTNNVDKPYRYDGSTVEEIPNLEADAGVTRCRALGVFKGALVLVNVVSGGSDVPRGVVWSSLGDASVWDFTTSSAGQNELFDTRDALVAVKPLGQDNILYGTRSITRMEFLGQDFTPFGFRTAVFGQSVGSEGIGCVAPNAVFPAGDTHIFLGRDGVYQYRGGFTVEPVSNEVFLGLFDANGEFDKANAHRSFVQYVDEQDEVFIFFPVRDITYPNRALVLNIKSGTWRRREFVRQFTFADTFLSNVEGLTWDEIEGVWPEHYERWISRTIKGEVPAVILGASSAQVYLYDYISVTEDATLITYEFQTKDVLYFDRDMLIDWVEFELRGSAILLQYSTDGGFNWFNLSGQNPVDAGSQLRLVRRHLQVTADKIRYRLLGLSGGGFELGRMSMKFREQSRFRR